MQRAKEGEILVSAAAEPGPGAAAEKAGNPAGVSMPVSLPLSGAEGF